GYNNVDFKGLRFIAVEDVDTFHQYSGGWGDRFDAVKVVKGPNYVEGDTARLYSKPYYGGVSVTLPPGNYSDLGKTDTSIKNAVESIQMGPTEEVEIQRWKVLRDRAQELRQCQDELKKKRQQADHLDERIRKCREEQKRLRGDSPPLAPMPRTVM
ncbi:MAG: hypothetical protein ACREYC_21930, partial [Gammaproteobacteria bacterium]